MASLEGMRHHLMDLHKDEDESLIVFLVFCASQPFHSYLCCHCTAVLVIWDYPTQEPQKQINGEEILYTAKYKEDIYGGNMQQYE